MEKFLGHSRHQVRNRVDAHFLDFIGEVERSAWELLEMIREERVWLDRHFADQALRGEKGDLDN